ncbi:hypothetical protein LPJ78_005560 [Coemansia sp. RSA 989]|nr:hypothetical protein LPJ68_005410 [Coemansia sp. RSA 1086]KAJ1746564.1 hypothetical protein LPJ79_005811 [Coemansia sp. RSA 1821]KAJ1861053.1 hypothetical protein LPJ78_005560 [Coemansia sp. RSA 989]KAJ2631832.1 hypothetical protein H4R22_001694 [Coemansia sp. RSA 1290]KAJ2651820.1 hypothetical protein IWW40_001368 [Coemansia sp. RSA 1250]KAJ2674849.1 hypothetical protein IWW42_001351 [Coemansia sp. RSA 1085]
MSSHTINLSSVSTRYGLADTLTSTMSQSAKTVAGWWEIPHYSTWDLGNKFACSQSTLVGRRSHDVSEKPIATAMPTLYSMQSTIAEEPNVRISFTQETDELPANMSQDDFGMGLGSEMGRAYRMHTLMNNPALIEQYHQAAKLTADPEVQFEFARQLLLCGTPEMASDSSLLMSDQPESKLVREGVFWILRLATKRNHKEACFLAGRWHELGKYGCRMHLRKAAKFYKTAAKANHTAAQHHLGSVYESMHKVRKAKECFELASRRGFSLSTYRLGMAYLCGTLGVTADFSMACSFLREALFHSTHPVADAGYHLAVALIQLPSFERSTVSEPHLYLKRAWMLGHADAGALLGDIMR